MPPVLKRILYIDATAGASGDMFLGALVDLGVPIRELRERLAQLRIDGFRLVRTKASRGGIAGTRVRVDTPADRGYRHLSDFEKTLKRSALSEPTKKKALRLLERIFQAEAKVHGKTVRSVHLHELGSLDTLVDVVGTLLAIEILGPDRIESSAVNVGGGTVMTEHGLMSVPAPATARLLKGAEIFADDSQFERTTPTGAVLVAGLAERFGSWPRMKLKKLGCGVGSKDPKDGRANILRLALGEVSAPSSQIVVMEATIDDMSGQLVGQLSERLLDVGALDMFVTPVVMKKSRAGFNVTVLAEPAKKEALLQMLFEESTTLGVRHHVAERSELERRLVTVQTKAGPIRIKVGFTGKRVLNVMPEFEDCRRAAKRHGLPVKDVQQMAVAGYRRSSNTR